MSEKEEGPQVPDKLLPYYCLLEAPRVPLDKEMVEIMLSMAFATDGDLGFLREEITQDIPSNLLLPRILESRLDSDAQISHRAWMHVLPQIKTPGDAVMWAYTLSVISWLQEGALVTDDMLMTHDKLFGLGIPDMDSADVMTIWDAQKYSDHPPQNMDNYLDYPWFWEEQKKELWGKGLDIIPVPQTGALALEEVT